MILVFYVSKSFRGKNPNQLKNMGKLRHKRLKAFKQNCVFYFFKLYFMLVFSFFLKIL